MMSDKENKLLDDTEDKEVGEVSMTQRIRTKHQQHKIPQKASDKHN